MRTVDSYSESNYSTNTYPISNASGLGFWYVGQSFAGDLGILNSAKFYLVKAGSPTGSCYAKIYAHTGTYGTSSKGTGSVLATSDAVDISTLSTSISLTTFTFSGANKIRLSSTYYVVVVTATYTFTDSGNRFSIGLDTTSPTHGGNETYNFGGSWSAESGVDAPFYVYSDDVIPSESPSLSPSSSVSPSISHSASQSPSASNSPSSSISPSVSPSSSASFSSSSSASVSPSASTSPSSSSSSSPSSSASRSVSPSASASSSASRSASPSPSPAPMQIRVAKAGHNALTETDPNKFIFHSAYNTFKIVKEGTATITYTANGRYAVAHGLSTYTPTSFLIFVKFPDGYTTNLVGTGYAKSRDQNWQIYDTYIDATEINMYIARLGGSSTSLTCKYYIFETPIG